MNCPKDDAKLFSVYYYAGKGKTRRIDYEYCPECKDIYKIMIIGLDSRVRNTISR